MRDPVSRGAGRARRSVLVECLGGVVVIVLTVSACQRDVVRAAAPAVSGAVQEVTTEADERAAFRADVRARFLRSEFASIEDQATRLRASRETFANGLSKLNTLYQTFQVRDGGWSDAEWTRAFEQAEAWKQARPKSVVAHIALAELWMAYAWKARGSDAADKVPAASWPVFKDRMQRAAVVLHAAEALPERCPRLYASRLALAVGGNASKSDEALVFAQGSREYPDFQPIYDAHLSYLDPKWHGAPGDWREAAEAIAATEGGREKYARAAWFVGLEHKPVRDEMSWPLLKQAFGEMVARYPDSLETKSAYCRFTVSFRDRMETRRLFGEIGNRMVPSVWITRKYFVESRDWANLEVQPQSPRPNTP